MSDEWKDYWRTRTNSTALDCYADEGPGAGAEDGAVDVLHERTEYKVFGGARVLEVGCGQCKLLHRLVHEFGCSVAGVDIAPCAKLHPDSYAVTDVKNVGNHVTVQDVSHVALPYEDNSFDFAFCTESIEHMANPYYMTAEVKRVLKHNGIYVLAHPVCSDNIGYGGGQHAHIYPWFLEEENIKIFMRQLYFKNIHAHQNGSTLWSTWKNYKGPGMVDAFVMTSGNHDEAELFRCLEDF